MSDFAFVTLSFNVPDFMPWLFATVAKFCGEPYDFVVCDDSTDATASERIKAWCEGRAQFYRLPAPTPDAQVGSLRAVQAIQHAYEIVRDRYDRLAFLDHDIFPIRPFTFESVTQGAEFAGTAQSAFPPRIDDPRRYFWPGLLFFQNRPEYRPHIDLGGAPELGFDTGGGTWKMIERVGRDRCRFIAHSPVENPYFRGGVYHWYPVYDDGGWIHFLNGSGWNWPESENQVERLSTLFHILGEAAGIPDPR